MEKDPVTVSLPKDFISNFSNFIHKKSPDRGSKNPVKWEPEEIKDYLGMAFDELLMREDVLYTLLYFAAKASCFAAALSLINPSSSPNKNKDERAKKFMKKRKYWQKKFDKEIEKFGPVCSLKIKR